MLVWRWILMNLTLVNLTKKYGSFSAVNEINYKMTNGIYGLLGINGAGKTTLMRMICTLLKPSNGSILCEGRDIFEMGEEYRKILGYLPQDFGFYPDLSANDYLMYISSIKGLRPAVAKDRTRKLLKRVGLEGMGKRKLKTFSGGMLRRVGIAQAMLNNPQILILDEPTAGLDPKERIRFRNLISELATDRLVLLSTHIVSDVEFIADQIILMNKGQLFCVGTVDQIVSSIKDKIWTCKVSNNEVDRFIHDFPVVNIKSINDGIEIRILSDDKPIPKAYSVQATLEDAFLFYFGEQVEEEK